MTIQEVDEDKKQKAYSMIQVLKILDNIANVFINQKEPYMYIIEASDQTEDKYIEAMNKIEELNFLHYEAERASMIITNNLFEIID